jgi:YcxB-like protein
MIKAEFEFRIDELRAGARAVYGHSGLRRRILVFWGSLLCLIWFLWMQRAPTTPVVSGGGTGAVIAPSPALNILQLLLWAAICFVICSAIFRALRYGGIRKDHWALGKICALEADPDRVTVSDAAQRTEYRWTAFHKFVETKNLFLLFTDSKMAVILPKRIFDAASLDEFRRLAQERMTPLATGFPVIPLAERSRGQDQSQQ